MPKVLHVSFLWDDETVNQRHSDYILAMGWVKEGWDVLYFDYRMSAEEIGNDAMNKSLIEIVKTQNPDILFFTKSEGTSRRFTRRYTHTSIHPYIINQMRDNGYKGTIVHWFLDQRFDFFESSIKLGKNCDWFFYVAAGERLKAYSDMMQTPASFIVVPYEKSFLNPQAFGDRYLDLVWMGGEHRPSKNHFENIRYNLLKRLVDSDILKSYYGCFRERRVFCPEYQQILGSTKMGLSLYAFDRPMYFSNRLSHIIGSNTALASYDFKDRKRIFSDDDGIFFKQSTELRDRYNYYMKNLDELEWVANNGHKIAEKYFSSTSVVKEILHTLRTGESALPFGETYNKKKLKYDVPVAGKGLGNIYYLDKSGNVISIDQYSESFDNNILLNKGYQEFDFKKQRLEHLKQQADRNNMRLQRRSREKLNRRRRRPGIQ